MRNRAFVTIPVGCCFVSLLCLVSVFAQPAAPVRLSIERQPGQNIRIAWSDSAVGFVLDSANPLSSPITWSPVAQTAALQNNQFSVTLQVTGGSRFFRLRLPGLTTIRESSPANGEEDVAVMRETIVWFTEPLATNAVVSTTNFYSGYGGRRLLSRVELSSDRMKATLFYLEPLPGSTRINAVFDATGLNDVLGQPLDPDGNGQPGGSAVISFTTLSTTPLAGTAMVGTVYASDLVPGAVPGRMR